MSTDPRLAQRLELAQAAEVLGNWLEAAGQNPGSVSADVWQRIADSAAKVVAAATALAGEKLGQRD